MTPTEAGLTLVAVALLAWVLTSWLRRYALAMRMVDVPNPRSSHQVETPRGGGGGIVVAATVGLAWWWWTSDATGLTGILLGGGIVAVVGFIDDHRHVHPLIRLTGHTVAAVLAVSSLTPDPQSAIVWTGLSIFFVTWLINLTNFMDGIDGIAGAEVLTVCAAGVGLEALVSPGTALWIEPAIVAAATAGFLMWNWPPARIFMGDVGSGFVGFMLAVLTLRAGAMAPELGWSWLILISAFVVDASVTLVRRAARLDPLFEAHRSHAYQHLAIAWGAHRPVTLLLIAINLCWLAPVAALVATRNVSGPTGLFVAYLPLVIGAFWFGAGATQRS